MDNQLPSPNIPTPAERPADTNANTLVPGVAPEAIPAVPAEAQIVMPAASVIAEPAASPAPVAAVVPVAAPVAVPGAPAVAGDVDVIEPEWVDKAEQVISAHQGDPYGEEEAIEKLQEDYLQKRYGMNVADPNSNDAKPNGS